MRGVVVVLVRGLVIVPVRALVPVLVLLLLRVLLFCFACTCSRKRFLPSCFSCLLIVSFVNVFVLGVRREGRAKRWRYCRGCEGSASSQTKFRTSPRYRRALKSQTGRKP